MITPVDAAFDFQLVPPERVLVGSEFLFTLETEGDVTTVTDYTGPPALWVYFMTDAEGGFTGAFIPQDPQTGPVYTRYYVWRRNPKPAVGDQFTGPGGSLWVYRKSGVYACWSPGGGFNVDDLAARSTIDGVTSDHPPVTDPLWDWEPIVDGSVVTPGDHIRWLYGVADVVDSVFTDDTDPADTVFTYSNAGAETLGTLHADDTRNRTTGVARLAYSMNAKPATGSRFRGTDSAEWIVTGTLNYRCYNPGTRYSRDAVYQLVDIDGQLTAI